MVLMISPFTSVDFTASVAACPKTEEENNAISTMSVAALMKLVLVL
jgi:hypothetical protein